MIVVIIIYSYTCCKAESYTLYFIYKTFDRLNALHVARDTLYYKCFESFDQSIGTKEERKFFY